MLVHDLGFRNWEGERAPGWSRWLVIMTTGIRRAWQSPWLRRLLFMAWIPTIVFAAAVFFFEQATENNTAAGFLEAFALNEDLREELLRPGFREDPASARHEVWSILLQTFFRLPQALCLVILVGLIGPPLISQDIRSRAFLLYFSRPINRSEYILGKAGTIWFYLSMITTIPALALYGLGVLLSPQLEVLLVTWDIPLRIVCGSLTLMIPVSAIALCLSSMTQESRIAGFAWFAMWIMGAAAYGFSNPPPMSTGVQPEWVANLSIYHLLGRIQRWIFGLAEFGEVRTPLIILVAITVISIVIVFRRVSAPMRA